MPGEGKAGRWRSEGRTTAPQPPAHLLPPAPPAAWGSPAAPPGLAALPRDARHWQAAPLPLPKHEADLEPGWETSLFRKGFSQSSGRALSSTPGGFVGLRYRHTKAASFTQPTATSTIPPTAAITSPELTANAEVPADKRRESNSQPRECLPSKLHTIF